MGAVFSFIKKTSFYRFYNYDDSYIDSDSDYSDSEYQNQVNYADYQELPYYGEINSKNLYDSKYNTYSGYSYTDNGVGVIYNIKD